MVYVVSRMLSQSCVAEREVSRPEAFMVGMGNGMERRLRDAKHIHNKTEPHQRLGGYKNEAGSSIGAFSW